MFLLRLAELELIDRERRMVERRIKEARFPSVKSLDSFDFAAIPSLNKTLVLELARSENVTRRENIIAVGNSEVRIHTAHLSISLDLQFFLLRITRRRTPKLAGLRCLLDFVTVEVVRENDPGRAFAELASRQRAVLDEAADRGRTDV